MVVLILRDSPYVGIAAEMALLKSERRSKTQQSKRRACLIRCALFVGDCMKTRLQELSRTEIHRLIDEYIHNERDRNVLKRRFTDGITYECLAEEFDMSVSQIKNIVYRSQDILNKHIGEQIL